MSQRQSLKLTFDRKLVRIPLEYKKKYAEIFLKDLIRKQSFQNMLVENLHFFAFERFWFQKFECRIFSIFLSKRDGIRILWLKFAIVIKKISRRFFLDWTMLNCGGKYHWYVGFIFKCDWYLRNTLRNIYDNREAILNEPLSPDAFCNKGLRLRKKIGRQQKLFEDRLAEVILNFSTKMEFEIGLVADIAQARILEFSHFGLKCLTVSWLLNFYILYNVQSNHYKELRSREFSDVPELKDLKFSYCYIRRFLSDQKLRKTNEHRLVITSLKLF